jgi:hypothetical protein
MELNGSASQLIFNRRIEVQNHNAKLTPLVIFNRRIEVQKHNAKLTRLIF